MTMLCTTISVFAKRSRKHLRLPSRRLAVAAIFLAFFLTATPPVPLLAPALIAHAAATFGTTLTMPGNNLGLVGHRTFDGKDLIQNVTDSSGQGNNGALVNFTSTTTVRGVLGQALSFTPGSNQHVLAPTISIPTSVTVSAWVYSSNFKQNGFIVEKAPANTQWELFFNSSDSDMYWRGGSTSAQRCADPSNGHWHQVAASQTGTEVVMYIDGVQCAFGAVTAIGNGSGNFWVGGYDAGSTYDFNGNIDDVRIYNRALSGAEVEQLYQQGQGSHIGSAAAGTATTTINTTITPPNLADGLVGHWTFDGKDMIGNIHDSSGQGNTGYLQNAATSTQTVMGKLGQAISFNGGQYIYGSSFSAVLGSNYAYCLWFKVPHNSTSMTLLDIGRTPTAYYGEGVFSFGYDNLSYYDWDGSYGFSGGGNLAITYRKWHFVCFVKSGGLTGAFYLDGGPDGTITATHDVTLNTSGFGIGADIRNLVSFLNGSIDDVRIYNRALSAAEVKQLYDLGR